MSSMIRVVSSTKGLGWSWYSVYRGRIDRQREGGIHFVAGTRIVGVEDPWNGDWTWGV